jgi:hypothetical protein
LRAFDQAAALLPEGAATADGPYVALDAVHLARWQGHALARVGDREAVEVLSSVLQRLDPTFIRAETSLRVDLAIAFAAIGERDESQHHVAHAATLATDIGSARQRRRLQLLNQRR